MRRSGPAHALLGLAAAAVLGLAAPRLALADEHRPDRAGNPVRIAAYVLSPPFVVLDYVLLRPAHWIGHFEPFRTLFGVQGSRRDDQKPTQASTPSG